MTVLVSAISSGIAGSTNVPGDKSVSHRALIFGALAVGETVVTGLLEGEDVLRTAQALRQLGAEITREETVDGPVWHIWGVGVGGLKTPDDILDMGNSGTGARLLMGLVAGHPVTAIFTGDDSLRGRPMGRVTVPLAEIGAQIESRSGGLLPVTVHGAADPLPISYRLPVASAQVKSAILLAGLNSQGTTTVLEPEATRDHTERMLRYFGATIRVADETDDDGKPVRRIELTGQPELVAAPVSVPGDPSSAAFAAVAAAIVPGSDVMIRNIGLNPLRTGLFDTLEEMGAALEWRNRREQGGEPVADLCVRAGQLRAVEPPAGRAPSMIDEYPILAVAAACAKGVTVLRGLAELRVKESDRLAAMANGLAACGVEVEELEDGLIIHGCDGPPPGGATGENRVVTHMDHRIAMAFLVLGMAAQSPVEIDDGDMIATSFPTFVDMMNGLGARISPATCRETA